MVHFTFRRYVFIDISTPVIVPDTTVPISYDYNYGNDGCGCDDDDDDDDDKVTILEFYSDCFID